MSGSETPPGPGGSAGGPVETQERPTASRSTSERVLRRFAGAGVAVLAAGAALGWTGYLAVLGIVTTYLVGVPLSLWLERRSLDGPGVLRRHLVAGLWAGGSAGFLVHPPGFLVTTTIGAGVGAAVALTAAAAGLRLPRRALWPAALLGPIVLVSVAHPVWQLERQLASTDPGPPAVVESVADVDG